MAVDFAIRIKIDSTVPADKRATLVRKVIQCLETQNLSIAYNVEYVEGTGTKNQVEVTIT